MGGNERTEEVAPEHIVVLDVMGSSDLGGIDVRTGSRKRERSVELPPPSKPNP